MKYAFFVGGCVILLMVAVQSVVVDFANQPASINLVVSALLAIAMLLIAIFLVQDEKKGS